MKAVRLHGSRDLRMEDIDDPPKPGPGEATIEIHAVGICGSDLHMYNTGTIGNLQASAPLVLGHEFMGLVRHIGENAIDGIGNTLTPGMRVAVDPACPCGSCELCLAGHPNLCPEHDFMGVFPTNGALCERITVPTNNCFVLPGEISEPAGALLETLGVALHAVDLAKLKPGDTAAVIGCGPVGLLIVRLLALAGVGPIFAFDKFPWRSGVAKNWGACNPHSESPLASATEVLRATSGRGVDVVFEAAWADESIQQAAEMVRYGGRLVLVGIPPDDRLCLQHATARRKGLTIRLSRRMKHTYPRAIDLAGGSKPQVDLDGLATHRFALHETRNAFESNIRYDPGLCKAVVFPARISV